MAGLPTLSIGSPRDGATFTFTLRIKPTSRGGSLLANATSPVVIRVTVAYTPTKGRARVVSVPGIVIPQERRSARRGVPVGPAPRPGKESGSAAS